MASYAIFLIEVITQHGFQAQGFDLLDVSHNLTRTFFRIFCFQFRGRRSAIEQRVIKNARTSMSV